MLVTNLDRKLPDTRALPPKGPQGALSASCEVLAESELAYLAGLMDGEGSFSICVNLGPKYVTFGTELSMGLHYGTQVLDDLKAAFGGNCYIHGSSRRWHLSRRAEVLEAAKLLQPYLRIKWMIARRFIAAVEALPTIDRSKGFAGGRALSREQAIDLAELSLSLNPNTRAINARKFLEQVDYYYPLEVAT